MTEIALELKNVSKRIKNKEIIKEVSFQIKQGEVFGFVGPNGAGKTTTIRMMVGLMKITEGDIHIVGKSIQTDYSEAIREVGAIVENPEMYPFLTGRKNLEQFARMVPGTTKERIEEVVQLVGLKKVINDRVGGYSLGMRQRLGIAQALLHKPSILILDEPTNGLDPSGMKEIRQYIRTLAEKENVSVIVSSHLLSEIELMCDRIGVIKNGSLIAVEDVEKNRKLGDTDMSEFIISVSNAQTAKAHLDSLDESLFVEMADETTLKTAMKREQIPAVLKELLNNNINVYEVQAAKGTLEDKFFDLIGENVIE
ncbi:ABC transporter ATP-binding protein [Oceanobacillus neutriphilus]|uniref:ABC transporter ATP-binding protein YhcH n=1 Tax=Oceanobacillus neutriphilus TaxID=531815 RepID=A0ABQ2P220_9BACI|nr:ABC transporter ATP-binding protein [Oceanobacillus neutriphilus]GGP15971.1 putative ABC transporter ATP-binding protein YhcH [Oceanobacillus neutriphilus]